MQSKDIFVVLIIVLILLCTFWSDKEGHVEITSDNDEYDYAKQDFKYKESEKVWNMHHGAIYDDLKDHAYVTFDLRYKSDEEKTVMPESPNDIKEIVKKNQGRKIRASGGHHTFNDISLSNDIIMRTFHLKKVLILDKALKEVNVEAGILLHELNLYLRENGLALPILPAIPWQSIAGALATSSHGSQTDRGSMSTMIVNMTLIMSDGSHRIFSRKDPEFSAVIAGLGCFGVVYAVTLKCVDAFAIKHQTKMLTDDEFKKEMNDPKNRKRFVYMQGYVYPRIKGKNVKMYYREVVKDFNKNKLPITYKTDKDTVESVKFNKYKDESRMDWSDNILVNNQEAGLYTEEEIVVNMKDWNNAVDDVIELYFKHEKVNNYVSGWPILVRFTRADDSLIGMVSGRDSVFIDIFNSRDKANDKNLDMYFRDFEELLINKYKGRPHYGKRHYLDETKMRKLYGNKIDEFNKIRKQLDPQGMFTNAYIERLFGKI